MAKLKRTITLKLVTDVLDTDYVTLCSPETAEESIMVALGLSEEEAESCESLYLEVKDIPWEDDDEGKDN